MSDYPKFQLSKFHGVDRSLESVFRTESEDEYKAKLSEWAKNDSVVTNKPPVSQDMGETCDKCGAEKVMGKKGNLYCKPCYMEWARINKPK